MKQNIIKLRKLSSCVFLAIILTLASSCDEDRVGQNPVDNVPPEGIKNVQIEALAGGAKISYDRSGRSPFFCHEDSLGRRFICCCEDARSIAEKLQLVSSRALAGVYATSLRPGAEFLSCFEAERFN